MKTTTLTTLLLLFIVFSRAQSVAIIPFSTGAANDYSAGVVDAVNTGFIEDKRFQVTPTDDWGLNPDAPDAAKTEAAMQKAKELGLDYLVTGSLTKANVMFYNNAYYGDFKFTLKVFNVETGMFFNTKSFSAGSIAGPYKLNEKASVDANLKKLMEDVKSWAMGVFPKKTEIVKIIATDDKKGATRVLISSGSNDGEQKAHTRFKIVEYVSEKVGDKTVKRTIPVGLGEVIKVEDANFSDFAVKRGGQDIVAKLQAGTKLYIRTG